MMSLALICFTTYKSEQGTSVPGVAAKSFEERTIDKLTNVYNNYSRPHVHSLHTTNGKQARREEEQQQAPQRSTQKQQLEQ